jgi:hypothetical protein
LIARNAVRTAQIDPNKWSQLTPRWCRW